MSRPTGTPVLITFTGMASEAGVSATSNQTCTIPRFSKTAIYLNRSTVRVDLLGNFTILETGLIVDWWWQEVPELELDQPAGDTLHPMP